MDMFKKDLKTYFFYQAFWHLIVLENYEGLAFVMSYCYFKFVYILVFLLIMNGTLVHSNGFESALQIKVELSTQKLQIYKSSVRSQFLRKLMLSQGLKKDLFLEKSFELSIHHEYLKNIRQINCFKTQEDCQDPETELQHGGRDHTAV